MWTSINPNDSDATSCRMRPRCGYASEYRAKLILPDTGLDGARPALKGFSESTESLS